MQTENFEIIVSFLRWQSFPSTLQWTVIFVVISLQFAVIGLQFDVITLPLAVIHLQDVSLLWNDLQPFFCWVDLWNPILSSGIMGFFADIQKMLNSINNILILKTFVEN